MVEVYSIINRVCLGDKLSPSKFGQDAIGLLLLLQHLG